MKKVMFLSAVLMLAGLQANAAEPKTYELTLKDHVFTPSELKIPANEAAILVVKNLDATAEEFESHKLKIEKVIAGNSEGKFHLRALEAGSYKFEGEYNSKTARGVIVAE